LLYCNFLEFIVLTSWFKKHFDKDFCCLSFDLSAFDIILLLQLPYPAISLYIFIMKNIIHIILAFIIGGLTFVFLVKKMKDDCIP